MFIRLQGDSLLRRVPPIVLPWPGATRIMLPSARLKIMLRWHVQGVCFGSYDFDSFLNSFGMKAKGLGPRINISPRLRRAVCVPPGLRCAHAGNEKEEAMLCSFGSKEIPCCG